MKKIIWICLFFSLSSFGSIKKYNSHSQFKTKIKKIRKKIHKQKKIVLNLSNKISKLESELGKRNDRFVKIIKLKTYIDNKIDEIQKNLSENKVKLKKYILKTKSIVKGLVLSEVDGHKDASDLIVKKLIYKKMVSEIQIIKKILSENKNLLNSLNVLNERFVDYKNIESVLTTHLSELEFKKKMAATKYIRAKKKQDHLAIRYDQIRKFNNFRKEKKSRKNKVRLTKNNVKIKFRSPLEKFVSIDYNRKGITYKFKGKEKVVATSKGKIIYLGSLSNYGNVIMIDHGGQTRSVLLGAFSPLVKKGQVVSVGDVMAMTTSHLGLENNNKLYFEVRKSNKAQNTVQLMSKNFLKKIKHM